MFLARRLGLSATRPVALPLAASRMPAARPAVARGVLATVLRFAGHRCEPKPSLSFRQVIIHSTEAKGRFWLTKAWYSGKTIGIRKGSGKGSGDGPVRW